MTRVKVFLGLLVLSASCIAKTPVVEEAPPELLGRAFRVTGYSAQGGNSSILAASSGPRILRTTDGSSTPAPSEDMPNWPRLSALLRGSCPLRIINVNNTDIRVGLRDGSAGRDLIIPDGGSEEMSLPGGTYSLYIQYGEHTGTLYEGPEVTLGEAGTTVEILPPK